MRFKSSFLNGCSLLFSRFPENFLKGLLGGNPPGLLCCTFWEEDKPAAGFLGSSCWATASDLSAASSVSFSGIIAPSLRNK